MVLMPLRIWGRLCFTKDAKMKMQNKKIKHFVNTLNFLLFVLCIFSKFTSQLLVSKLKKTAITLQLWANKKQLN